MPPPPWPIDYDDSEPKNPTVETLKKIATAGFISVMFYASVFFTVWTPIAVFYFSFSKSKKDWWLTFSLLLITALVVYSFWLPFLGFFHAAFYLITALFLSFGVWKKWPIFSWGMISGLGVTAVLFCLGFLIQKSGLFDLQETLHQSLVDTAAALDDIIHKPEFIKERQELIPYVLQIKRTIFYFPKLLPTIVFIYVAVIFCSNVALLRHLYILRKELAWVGKFRSLRVPSGFIWALIVCGGGFLLNDVTWHQGWLKIVFLNGVLISGFVYFVQGLSISVFFLRRFSLLFRFVIYGLVFLFMQILSVAIVGLGVADVWLDFRRLHKEKK